MMMTTAAMMRKGHNTGDKYDHHGKEEDGNDLKTAAMMRKSQYLPVSVFLLIIISMNQKIMFIHFIQEGSCYCVLLTFPISSFSS